MAPIVARAGQVGGIAGIFPGATSRKDPMSRYSLFMIASCASCWLARSGGAAPTTAPATRPARPPNVPVLAAAPLGAPAGTRLTAGLLDFPMQDGACRARWLDSEGQGLPARLEPAGEKPLAWFGASRKGRTVGMEGGLGPGRFSDENCRG